MVSTRSGRGYRISTEKGKKKVKKENVEKKKKKVNPFKLMTKRKKVVEKYNKMGDLLQKLTEIASKQQKKPTRKSEVEENVVETKKWKKEFDSKKKQLIKEVEELKRTEVDTTIEVKKEEKVDDGKKKKIEDIWMPELGIKLAYAQSRPEGKTELDEHLKKGGVTRTSMQRVLKKLNEKGSKKELSKIPNIKRILLVLLFTSLPIAGILMNSGDNSLIYSLLKSYGGVAPSKIISLLQTIQDALPGFYDFLYTSFASLGSIGGIMQWFYTQPLPALESGLKPGEQELYKEKMKLQMISMIPAETLQQQEQSMNVTSMIADHEAFINDIESKIENIEKFEENVVKKIEDGIRIIQQNGLNKESIRNYYDDMKDVSKILSLSPGPSSSTKDTPVEEVLKDTAKVVKEPESKKTLPSPEKRQGAIALPAAPITQMIAPPPNLKMLSAPPSLKMLATKPNQEYVPKPKGPEVISNPLVKSLPSGGTSTEPSQEQLGSGEDYLQGLKDSARTITKEKIKELKDRIPSLVKWEEKTENTPFTLPRMISEETAEKAKLAISDASSAAKQTISDSFSAIKQALEASARNEEDDDDYSPQEVQEQLEEEDTSPPDPSQDLLLKNIFQTKQDLLSGNIVQQQNLQMIDPGFGVSNPSSGTMGSPFQQIQGTRPLSLPPGIFK